MPVRRRVDVNDHQSNKAGPPVHFSGAEGLEEDVKARFHELRNGKIWFSEEIKKEHRRLKTSLFRYVVRSRVFGNCYGAVYLRLHRSVCAA